MLQNEEHHYFDNPNLANILQDNVFHSEQLLVVNAGLRASFWSGKLIPNSTQNSESSMNVSTVTYGYAAVTVTVTKGLMALVKGGPRAQ